MKLIEKIRSGKSGADDYARVTDSGSLEQGVYHSIKSMVHFRLVEQLDLASVTQLPRESLAATIREVLREITAAENIPLNRRERIRLVSDLMDEILGLGPIEPLMADAGVQDILVNGCSHVYVERNGMLQLTPVQFRDNDHLMQVIDKIVSAVGRRIDESSPMVDARLADGSRVNVIIPPLALNGPVVSIRKFGRTPISWQNLVDRQSLTQEMLDFLRAAIHAKLNILISGGTGAGKTTLLNVLSEFIPETERIITIEDSAELRLHQPHVVSLESRIANTEGRGEVRLTDLVKNSLRMRPDRIIVGEVRGAEVMDMLQAMNTGHPGSMSTIHANSPKDALSRMEMMAGMASTFFSEKALQIYIASAINIVVQLARLPDGKRRTVSISELTHIKDDEIRMRDIFLFSQEGVDENGRIFGMFRGMGVPECLKHIETRGLRLAPETFQFQHRAG